MTFKKNFGNNDIWTFEYETVVFHGQPRWHVTSETNIYNDTFTRDVYFDSYDKMIDLIEWVVKVLLI